MKILIIGSARHGKDTVAAYIREFTGMQFESSSEAAARIFLYDTLKEKYGYENIQQCFEDRVNHRKEWHDLIVEYNKEDRTRLAKEILKTSDIYVGMRSDTEIQECKNQGLFDYVIGVYNPNRPIESEESFDVDLWDNSDFLVWNDGTLEDLKEEVKITLEAINGTNR